MTAWRVAAIALASALLGALITLAIVHKGAKEETSEAKPAETAERVAVESGETIVSIDAETAARSHLTVAPLKSSQQSQSATSYATAVDVRDLVDARNQLEVARAQAEQARARLAAAQAEYARSKTLHDDNRNVSDRVLQEAEANVRAEQAGVASAEATMRAAASGVGQRWGNVVANAFASHAQWIDDLMSNRRVLVQVVSAGQPPRKIALQTAQGDVEATFVSPAVRVDPRVQGRSWFYIAPARNIGPGMALTARIAQGASRSGVIVPREAVVWSDGRAWIYVERAANRFARTEIDTGSPASNGYFVTTLAPGTRVVVSGAQQLLSEESKPKVEE